MSLMALILVDLWGGEHIYIYIYIARPWPVCAPLRRDAGNLLGLMGPATWHFGLQAAMPQREVP